MKLKKVYLTGRDHMDWATDNDYALLAKALEPFTELTDLTGSEIVHSVNWSLLFELDAGELESRRVIAHVPHDVRVMLQQPKLHFVAPLVDQWVVQSTLALRLAEEAGLDAIYMPYTVDPDIFRPFGYGAEEVCAIAEEFSIPKDKYLIGSFQRDTEGRDLSTPKYVKGPDIFLEVLKRVWSKHKNLHVVLAGPRRFWIRKELERHGIPYTFVGEPVDYTGSKDDVRINTLSQEKVNLLYNMVDLYMVSSRMEGGPKAVLEAASAGCKIISTPVGQARDVLDERAIYEDPVEGAALVMGDIEKGTLKATCEHNSEVAKSRSVKSAGSLWRAVYEGDKPHESWSVFRAPKKPYAAEGFLAKATARFFKPGVAILHKFKKPPWGGGNQFLLALKKGFESRRVKVKNKINYMTTACLFNSFTFDFGMLEQFCNGRNIRFIHRVDGPTFLVRGQDAELDDKVFDLNNSIADVTVFQSFWSYRKTIELGYKPVNPVIIPNAVDPDIFNSKDRIPFSKERKVRLISTSWSDNPRKGGPLYKWLEDHLDWDRFEYTFVGRCSERLDKIRQIEPVPSVELAKLLREHDIYITASRNDPCSNALIEALACGLPALYLNDGGHPELVGYGGLSFNDNEEILPQLDKIAENYEMYQNLITVPSMDEVVEKYLALLE